MSKFRTKIDNILNSASDLSEVDAYVKRYNCTYRTIYECLASGLTLDETDYLLDVHRSLPFTPYVVTLRHVFISLKKDQEHMDEAMLLLEEYLDYLRGQAPENWSQGARDGFALKEFRNLLSEHNGSLSELKAYLDQLEWQEDLRSERLENF